MKPLAFTLEEMGALLSALDVLSARERLSAREGPSGPGASATDTDAAAEVVRSCHAQAEEACVRLRRHLTWAEELTARLAVLPGVSTPRA